MLTCSLIDALVADGFTAEQLASVVKAHLADQERIKEERAEKRRADTRERVRRHREKNKLAEDVTHVTRYTPDPSNPPQDTETTEIAANPAEDVTHVTPCNALKRVTCVTRGNGFPFSNPLPYPSHTEGDAREALPPKRDYSADFERLWKAYPKRGGSNPKAPAAKKYAIAVKAGANREEMQRGAERYAAEMTAAKKIGTEFVRQTVTWLNGEGWRDDPIETQVITPMQENNLFSRGANGQKGTWAQADRKVAAGFSAIRQRMAEQERQTTGHGAGSGGVALPVFSKI